VYVRDGYDYWQQLADGRVFLGGGRDHFEQDEYTSSDLPTEPVQQWLESRLRSSTRTTAPVVHRWAATVTYTSTSLPIARQFSDGVWGAGGYCGTGNVVGALCGSGLVRRALGHPDRFLDLIDAA
jgi:glycine/D-amino acid oxidase-like deaminating enzyme